MMSRAHTRLAIAVLTLLCGCELLAPPRGLEPSATTGRGSTAGQGSGAGSAASTTGTTGTTGTTATSTTGSASAVSSSAGSSSSGSTGGTGGTGGWCQGGHPRFLPTQSHINVPNSSFGSRPTDFVLGHFNGDSNLDLAEINVNFTRPDQYVYVFPGQGDGTFNAAQAAFGANIPGAVAAGDFNGDGLLDLAVSEAQAHTVNLIFGLADGGFRQGDDGGLAPGSQIWNGNDNAVRMIAAPLDNPVRSELVMINSNAIDHNIGVMRHVDAGVVIDDYAALDPTHVALGDFNGDHQLDIAFLVDAGSISQLKLLIGKGDGTFQDAQVDPVSLASTGLAVADLNGDGFADAVILQPNANGGTVVIWTGQPDAGLSFLPPTLSIASDPVATTFPAWVGASDLNGDGVQDLLVMHACSANCSAPHTFMSVLLGQGDGGFGSEIPYQGLASSNLAAIADLNHDGKPDLLFLSDTSQFEVLLQSGCGP